MQVEVSPLISEPHHLFSGCQSYHVGGPYVSVLPVVSALGGKITQIIKTITSKLNGETDKITQGNGS